MFPLRRMTALHQRPSCKSMVFVLTPGGNVYPLKVALPSGTTLVSLPGEPWERLHNC
jgi:hypothetical protein